MGLGVRQNLFVQAYLLEPNATKAVIAAGYKCKDPESYGSKLLKLPKVFQAIAEAQKRRSERVEVKQDDVLRELVRVFSCDIGKAFDAEGRLLPLAQMPEDVRRAITAVEVVHVFDGKGPDRYHSGDLVKVKFADKVKGIELGMRHLGLLKDNLHVTGKLTLEQLVNGSLTPKAGQE